MTYKGFSSCEGLARLCKTLFKAYFSASFRRPCFFGEGVPFLFFGPKRSYSLGAIRAACFASQAEEDGHSRGGPLEAIRVSGKSHSAWLSILGTSFQSKPRGILKDKPRSQSLIGKGGRAVFQRSIFFSQPPYA